MGLFDVSTRYVEPWRAKLFTEIEAHSSDVHNFSIGLLDAYFGLGALPREQIHWQDSVLRLSGLKGAGRVKTFVFAHSLAAHVLAAESQNYGVVYSLPKLQLTKQTKFRETAYHLDAVFSSQSYKNSRHRNKRLHAPLRRLIKNNVSIRQAIPADMISIEALHKEWVAIKMADPHTVRIMFPKVRYLSAIRIAMAQPDKYLVMCAFLNEQLIACRALYLNDVNAFDLSFFGAFWRIYPMAMEDVNLGMMGSLRQRGCKFFNCGATLNSRLGAFKAHWPAVYPMSYAYGRIKKETIDA